MTFEQGGIFIMQHLLRHVASVFPVSSVVPPHSVISSTHMEVKRTYSNPDPHNYAALLNPMGLVSFTHCIKSI
jgi:hypothetical protein